MQSAAESYMSRSPYVAFKLPGLFLAGTIASLESPKPLKTMIVLKAKINLVIYCRRRQLRFIYKCWCMQAERRGASNLWLLNDLRLRACRKHFSGTSSVKVSSVFSTWACLKQIFFFFPGVDSQTQQQLVSIKRRLQRGCNASPERKDVRATMRLLNQGESFDHLLI